MNTTLLNPAWHAPRTPSPMGPPAAAWAVIDPADAALRARVLARLEADPGWAGAVSNVVVLDGAVILQGLFRHEAERRATRALAQRQPGVRQVRDARVRAREWQSLG